MRRVVSLVLACVFAHMAAQPLLAQQRVILLGNRDIFEIDTSLSTFGRVTRHFPWTSPHKVFDMTPIAGGALVAWTNDGVIHVLEVQSGSRQDYTIPGFFVESILGTDATTFRVFLVVAGGVLVVDLRTGSMQTIDLGVQSSRGLAYAPRANLLFVGRSDALFSPVNRIDVIDAVTGATVKTFPVPAGYGDVVQSVDRAGTRLFLAGQGLTALDALTGGLVGNIPASAIIGAMTIDDHRNRLLVELGRYPNQQLAAFSLDSMQPLGQIVWQSVGMNAPQLLDVSPQSASMLALVPRGGCGFFTLTALNVDTGQLRTKVDLPELPLQIYDCDDVDLVRLTEPSAPRNFGANVTGSHVELSWAPTGALRYEIEAGSAPGLTNLATVSVTDTHLTVDGVPPGVYYLRVRAINTIGKSGASQEVRVVVE